jgi:tetratricopeptide (TPR) repeat protein
MSFNAKHYVALGLGFAVLAGFAMHKSTAPKKSVVFETSSGEFKPLSSFDNTIQRVPRIAAAETEPTPLDNKISTLQFVAEDVPGAQQVTFDSGDAATNDIDFSIPEFVEDADLEIAPLASTTIDPSVNSAFNLAESTEPADQKVQHPFNLPNSQWKPNPIANPAMAEAGREPAIDEPTAQVPALKTAADSTIIVEPRLDKPIQVLAEETETVATSEQPTLVPEATESADVALEVNEVSSESSDSVAPLQISLAEAAAQQAVHHIEYGKSLARRGAAFAARQEFYSALRVIAVSNDTATGSNDYSKALSQAILAMKEAKDFVCQNAEAEMLFDVASIVDTHRSKIIGRVQAETTRPGQALKLYFTFAEQKLDQSSGRSTVSAEALYCLGKLHTTVSKTQIIPGRIDVARATAYYLAALKSDRKNFRSANELGVLMVRMGQLETGTELFKQSLIAQPTLQTWSNLSKTHRRLGQNSLAQLAHAELALLSQTQVENSAAAIRWMPNTTFNAKAPMELHETKRVATRPLTSSSKPKTTSDPEQSKRKSLAERLKELF